jgi:hypothetical protein
MGWLAASAAGRKGATAHEDARSSAAAARNSVGVATRRRSIVVVVVCVERAASRILSGGVDIFSSVRFAGFEEIETIRYDQTVTKPFNNSAYLPILI